MLISMSLHAFHETQTPGHIFIYQFCYHDDFIAKNAELSFYPFDKIYLLHKSQTTNWANQMQHMLAQDQSIAVSNVYQIPFKPLIGIKAPAIALEIGLKKSSDWYLYSDIIATALACIIEKS